MAELHRKAGIEPAALVRLKEPNRNADWLRLQVLTHNLLRLLKAAALPPDYATAHPKQLRFAIFTQLGRVISHAAQILLRIATKAWETLIRPAYHRLLTLSPPN